MDTSSLAGSVMIFGTMIVVGIGSVISFNLHKLRVPYSVAMFIFGMIIGIVSFATPQQYDPVTQYYDNIPPNLLFQIFLPALIFEGSYSIKPFALRRVFRQAAILATLGVLVNAVLIAGLVSVLLPSWPWFASLLMGSILSATDPVAVVSLLKTLGVSAELTACIDAESLLNDGTAIILFQLIVPSLESSIPNPSVAEACIIGLRLTVVAVGLGLGSGWVLRRVIDIVSRDEVAVALVSLSFAYVVYYVADVVLQTSGVLTLFFAGTYLASNAPSLFPGSRHSLLHYTWGSIVYILNTLIFTFAGIIVSSRVVIQLKFEEACVALATYIGCNVFRLVMITLLLPLLNWRSGWHVSWKSVLVLTHSGLRGGVATILALNVFDNEAIPFAFRRQFLDVACVTVMLTIVINAVTSAPLVKRLDLQSKKQHRHEQVRLGLQIMRGVASRFSRADRNEHSVLMDRCDRALVAHVVDSIKNPFAELGVVAETEDMLIQNIILRVFKNSILFFRDRGRCTEDILVALLSVAQRHISDGTLPRVAHIAVPLLWKSTTGRAVAALSRCVPRLQPLAERHERRQNVHFFSLIATYGDVLQRVEDAVRKFEVTPAQRVLVDAWLDSERQSMERLLKVFEEEHPEATGSVLTSVAAAEVLQMSAESAETLHSAIGLSQFDTGALLDAVEAAKARVSSISTHLSLQTPDDVFASTSLGAGLCDATRELLRRRWSVVHASAGASTAPFVADGVGIMIRGIAFDATTELGVGVGELWGLGNFLERRSSTPALYAITPIAYVVLALSDLDDACRCDAVLHERLVELSAQRVAARLITPLLRCLFPQPEDASTKARLVCEKGTLLHGDVDAPNTTTTSSTSSSSYYIVCFIRGSDESGLLTSDASTPLILPRGVKFRWRPHTVLLRVRVDSGSPMVPSSAPVEEMVPQCCGFVDSTALCGTADNEVGVGLRGLQEPCNATRGGPQTTQHSELLSPSAVPLWNVGHMRFLSARDWLMRMESEHAARGTWRTWAALCRAVDHTLHEISLICNSIIPAAEHAYESAGLPPERLALQRREHAQLRQSLDEWHKRRALGDTTVHRDIIAQMATLIAGHFPADVNSMDRPCR